MRGSRTLIISVVSLFLEGLVLKGGSVKDLWSSPIRGAREADNSTLPSKTRLLTLAGMGMVRCVWVQRLHDFQNRTVTFAATVRLQLLQAYPSSLT